MDDIKLIQHSSTKQIKQLLLVLPVPFVLEDNQLFIEYQACNGLERWADNFGSVVIAAPVIPPELATKEKSVRYKNATSLVGYDRFEFVPLPWAYSLSKFLASYRSVRQILAELISRCRYLQFAIHGLWGDWASIGALEAHKQGRSYAVHTDIVDYLAILQMANTANFKQKIKAQILSFLTAKYHHWIIKNCALGLWHGNDCYSVYSPWCSNSHLIHDIHLQSSDAITPEELVDKLEKVATDPVLRICYAGRIEAMKGPFDWVKAINQARQLGVNLKATWMGGGSLEEPMKTLIEELGLNSDIELTGFIKDRNTLLSKIKESHLMVFTHLTMESPRCLVEALMCGTPIVGYRSYYVEDLVKNFGGGEFVSINNWQELGELLANLSKDKNYLLNLIQKAAQSGERFNSEAVFQERSQLIKNYLT